MVNKSKKIEVKEIIKPNIINGLDLTFSSFLNLFFEEGKFFVPKDKCLQYDIPWESSCPNAHSFSDLQRCNDL